MLVSSAFILGLAVVGAVSLQDEAASQEALAAEDECRGGIGTCALSALQVRSRAQDSGAMWEDSAEEDADALFALDHTFSEKDLTFHERYLSCEVNPFQAMFFTANGLANDYLKDRFAQLVRAAFPDRRANSEGLLEVKTLALWDSCFLKESVWNKDWKCTYRAKSIDFNDTENYNYSALAAQTDASLFEAVELNGTSFGNLFTTAWESAASCEAQGMKLEPYWCEDFGGALKDFKNGHQIHFQVTPMSLIDRFASPFVKRALAELSFREKIDDMPDATLFQQTLKQELDKLPVEADYDALLSDIDVVAFDGGNPDLTKFALSKLSPAFAEALKKRVLSGKTVFIGRSAGAMNGAQDLLTYEPNPNLWSYLFGDSTTLSGMQLMGTCAIRPHWSAKWKPAVLLYSALATTKEHIVPIRNGEGVSCSAGVCKRFRFSNVADNDEIDVGELAETLRAARATCGVDTDATLWDWCQMSRHLDLGFIKLPGKCVNLFRTCFQKLSANYCGNLVNRTFSTRNEQTKSRLLEQCLQRGRA